MTDFSIPKDNGRGPLRAGLWGGGPRGRLLLEALNECQGVRIEALADGPGEALLADSKIDLIIIPTPSIDHGSAALAALAAGKHVLVESPLATTLDLAQRIVDLAAERRLIVAVDCPLLYTPLIEAVTVFRGSQLAGPLVRIYEEDVIAQPALDAGFLERAAQFFDWSGRIAGKSQQVTATTSAEREGEGRLGASVRHENGVLTSYSQVPAANPNAVRTRTVIAFESVDLILDGWPPAKLRLSGAAAAVSTTAIRRMLRRTVASIPDVTAGFVFDAGAERELLLEGIRAGVEDAARAVFEPGYVSRNDARDVLRGLNVALAACTGAHTGSAQDI